MRTLGNRKAESIYGVKKVSPDAAKAEKQRYVTDKYEKLAFVKGFSACAEAAAAKSPAPAHVNEFQLQEKRSTRQCQQILPDAASARQGGMPILSRKSDLSDSFFDDLFGKEQEPSKSNAQSELSFDPFAANQSQSVGPNCTLDFDELDAFLNDALKL